MTPILITYRRKGGVVALLVLGVLAIAGTLLMVTVAAALTILAVAVGTVAGLARAVGWRPWRRRAVPAPASLPGDTIEGTVVSSAPSERAQLPK